MVFGLIYHHLGVIGPGFEPCWIDIFFVKFLKAYFFFLFYFWRENLKLS